MRSSKQLFFLSLALVMAFTLVQVQQSCAQMMGRSKLYGDFKMPKVGSYASYKVTYQNKEANQIIKLAIVGTEKSAKGEDLYWYERQETSPKTGRVVIFKMLISGDPQEIGTVHRIIFKDHKEKAQELPQAFIQLMNQPPEIESKAEEPKVKKVGTEKMRIADTTLTCMHTRYTYKDEPNADVWTAEVVPLFGLVKSETLGMMMELLDYGTDAVTGVKEEPEQLEMPQGQ
jgi:hypothetical protein